MCYKVETHSASSTVYKIALAIMDTIELYLLATLFLHNKMVAPPVFPWGNIMVDNVYGTIEQILSSLKGHFRIYFPSLMEMPSELVLHRKEFRCNLRLLLHFSAPAARNQLKAKIVTNFVENFKGSVRYTFCTFVPFTVFDTFSCLDC
jgi:hypothetical protein